MQGIYLIVNKINQNCYVGQSIDINRRWLDHMRDCYNPKVIRHNYPLYRAIRKYGVDNFEFLILETLDNESQEFLLDREIFWYETFQPQYNQVYPSAYVVDSIKRHVYQIDKNNFNIIKEHNSITEAAKEIGCSSGSIVNVCKKRKLSVGGYYWCYIEDYTNFSVNHKRKRQTIQIDPITLNVINTFTSAAEAARSMGVTYTAIKHAIYNKHKSVGYLWSYA